MEYKEEYFLSPSIDEAKSKAINELGEEKILEFLVIRSPKKTVWEGEGKTVKDIIWEGSKWYYMYQRIQVSPNSEFCAYGENWQISEPEIIQKGESGIFRATSQTEEEAEKLFRSKISSQRIHHLVECETQPTNGFMGIGKKPGIWKISWEKPFVVRITYLSPAIIKVKYKE